MPRDPIEAENSLTGTNPSGKPGKQGQAYAHGEPMTVAESLKAAEERKRTQPLSYAEQVQERKIREQREKAAKKKR